MYRPLVISAITTVMASILASGPAWAQDGAIQSRLIHEVPAHGTFALNTDELKSETGGLRTPTGIEFGLGATITTYVDGQMALKSQLTWTDNGPVETTTPGALTGAAAAGIHIDGVTPGTFLTGDNGGTVVLHDLGDGRIGSVVLNTADNRDIRQETVVNLNLPDLTNYQNSVISQQAQIQVQNALDLALSNLPH